MAQIEVSDHIHRRVQQFRTVIESVIDDQIDDTTCAELVLARGMDAMVSDLLGDLDAATLLKSILQLADKHPAEVYGYVAETLKKGGMVQERERLRKQMGFHVPPGQPTES